MTSLRQEAIDKLDVEIHECYHLAEKQFFLGNFKRAKRRLGEVDRLRNIKNLLLIEADRVRCVVNTIMEELS